MESWYLTKLLSAGTVAVARGETTWSLVDETGRSSVGRSLEDVLVRASSRRPPRDRSSQPTRP